MSVYDWAKKNISVRWKFTDEQVKLIYDILDKVKVEKLNKQSATYDQWEQPIIIDREEYMSSERGPSTYHDYPENSSDVRPHQKSPFTLDRLSPKTGPTMDMGTTSPAYYISMPAESVKCEFEFHGEGKDKETIGEITWDKQDISDDLSEEETFNLLFHWLNERFREIFPILGMKDSSFEFKDIDKKKRRVEFKIKGSLNE